MEEFSLPEDITALTDDELDALLDGAVKAFDAKAGSSTVTTDDLTKLRELATAVEDIRKEKAERIAAAEQAAAEIEQLAAAVRGDDPEEPTVAANEPEEPAEPEPVAEPEPEKPVTAFGAVAKARAPDLSRVRVHQPRMLPRTRTRPGRSPRQPTCPATSPASRWTWRASPRASSAARTRSRRQVAASACAHRTGCRSTRTSSSMTRARVPGASPLL
ncbi:hypothetical protein AB0N14_17890 [Streptomyces sp. NPDC051104]|uniref:hypothetical protein n=1 Tax=Streptomyces sp. NPDC051104 TaxID=3155044 RepID=UPI003427F5DA